MKDLTIKSGRPIKYVNSEGVECDYNTTENLKIRAGGHKANIPNYCRFISQEELNELPNNPHKTLTLK